MVSSACPSQKAELKPITHDETAVFSQQQQFRLISDHLVQKGPSFPRPIDMTIDTLKGQVTVRYADDHGQTKVESEHLDLPPDLANGLIVTAPLIGKQPPDSHVWILAGEAPAFVKSEQPLYNGGPVWRIELVSPVWPKQAPVRRSSQQ